MVGGFVVSPLTVAGSPVGPIILVGSVSGGSLMGVMSVSVLNLAVLGGIVIVIAGGMFVVGWRLPISNVIVGL